MLATAIIAITTATTRKDAVLQLLLLLLLRPQRRVPIVNKQMRSNFSFRNVSTVAKASNGELPPVTETTADSVKWPKCSHYREGKGGGKSVCEKELGHPDDYNGNCLSSSKCNGGGGGGGGCRRYTDASVSIAQAKNYLSSSRARHLRCNWALVIPLSDHVSYRAHTHTLTHSAHNFLSGCDSLRPVTLIKEHSS